MELVTDNGPQFTSKEFRKFMAAKGIKHYMGAPYHPQTNGLAERSVQTVKKSLKRQENSKDDMDSKLAKFLMSYRNTPHTSTGKSPAEMLLGRPLRSNLDLLQPPKDKNNSTVKSNSRYIVGQTVLARDFRRNKKWRKGVILKQIGKFLFLVQVEGGVVKRHTDQMLPIDVPPNTDSVAVQPDFEPEIIVPPEVGSAANNLGNSEDGNIIDGGSLSGADETEGPVDVVAPEHQGFIPLANETQDNIQVDPSTIRRSTRTKRTPKHLDDFVLYSKGNVVPKGEGVLYMIICQPCTPPFKREG